MAVLCGWFSKIRFFGGYARWMRETARERRAAFIRRKELSGGFALRFGLAKVHNPRAAIAGDDLVAAFYFENRLWPQRHIARTARTVDDLGYGDAIAAALSEAVVDRGELRTEFCK